MCSLSVSREVFVCVKLKLSLKISHSNILEEIQSSVMRLLKQTLETWFLAMFIKIDKADCSNYTGRSQ